MKRLIPLCLLLAGCILDRDIGRNNGAEDPSEGFTILVQGEKGAIDLVSDEDILAAQRWLAQHEGIFVEPASAASIAGLFKCCDSREATCSFRGIPKGSRIVCTVTGHGLKDPDVIIRQLKELKPIAATVSDVRRAIEL